MSIEQQKIYQTIGSGKDLVLIHGWGVSSAIWQPVIARLSLQYRIHLVDLPGVGGQPELNEYSLATIADTLLAHLPKNAIWCGWSLGGLVATYVAVHFPERVNKLVQVCTSMKFVETNHWSGVSSAVFDAFKKGVLTQPQKTLNRFIALQAMGSKTVKDDVITIKSLEEKQPELLLSSLISGLELLRDVDLREDFSQLTMPCLSLFGEHDTLVPLSNVDKLLALQPRNQQVIFHESSHAPFISENEYFSAVLMEFIESE